MATTITVGVDRLAVVLAALDLVDESDQVENSELTEVDTGGRYPWSGRTEEYVVTEWHVYFDDEEPIDYAQLSPVTDNSSLARYVLGDGLLVGSIHVNGPVAGLLVAALRPE